MLFSELDATTQERVKFRYGPHAEKFFNQADFSQDQQNHMIDNANKTWAKFDALKQAEPEPEQPKRGRPKVLNEGRTLSFWVDQDTIEDLQHYAKKYGMTVSALIRLCLSCGLESCKQNEKNESDAHPDGQSDNLDPEPVKEEKQDPDPAPQIKIPQPNLSTVSHFR